MFNVQRYSTHDGPGIRTTVFLKGCPLRCAWCHNPEGLDPRPEVVRFEDRCIGCGACREVCPATPQEHTEPEHCLRCGACADACPSGARELAGRVVGARELVAELVRDRLFFDDSGGGVTFSGGEPLAQPEFLLACLELLHEEGVHTAVDTSGRAGRDTMLAVVRRCDLVLFDVKLMDPELHLATVGAPLAPILHNLAAAAAHHGAIWLRLPLIPGVSDTAETVVAVAELAASLGSVQRLSLLPYHRTGTSKYRRLGRSEPQLQASEASVIQELAGRARAASGLEVTIGG